MELMTLFLAIFLLICCVLYFTCVMVIVSVSIRIIVSFLYNLCLRKNKDKEKEKEILKIDTKEII